MKIAVIAPTYIPARRANTVQVMKMTQALALVGNSVRLAVPTFEPARSYGWEELARQYGLRESFPIEWLSANPRGRGYDFAWRAVGWAKGADLIYTRLPQAAALASQWGYPTLLEAHDLPQGRMGPWMFRRFLKGRGARRLVVITHSLVRDLSRQFGAPDSPPFTVTAPDGVDLERYAGLPAPEEARRRLSGRLPIQWEGFTTGYTGHLYPGRGRRLLLSLAKRLPDIHFLVVGGEPPEVARLRAEVDQKGLKNLLVTGFVPNADLPLYQAACEVLLMPYQRQVAGSSGGDISHYLSPMKLFEYLACGRAILSSDLPVLQETLNANNSILLPPDDETAWANALQALQTDPLGRKRLGEQARQDASRYSWEKRAACVLQGL